MSASSIVSALKKLKALLTPQEKWTCVGIVLFALCTSILEVVTALGIAVFAQVLTQPLASTHYLAHLHRWGFMLHTPASRFLLLVTLFIGIIYLIKNSLMAVELFHQNFSIQHISYDFKNRLLQQYIQSDYNAYLMRNSSTGIQIIQSDTEQLFSYGVLGLASIVSEGLVFVLLLSMIIYMNPSLAMTVFGMIAVLGFICMKWVFPKFYHFGEKQREASLATYHHVMQFFHAFKEIILLGKKDWFINEYKRYSYKKSRIQALQNAINALPRLVLELIFVGIFVVTIVFLYLRHQNSLQMTGLLGAYLYTGFRLMPGLNRMIYQLNTFKASIPSIERVYTEYRVSGDKEMYAHVPEFRFTEALRFDDVSFRYMNTKKDALSHVSFEIKKGENIGIVGETGSGKSTLVDVLLGLLQPYQGTVLVDEKFPVNACEWHQKIGYVPQSVYLTDDTIAANIAFGEDTINEARLAAAIESAQLQEFIHQLPNKEKTLVGERGVRLSGGERQRIAIARALYRHPEVLIFDEATSALDNETEARLMETIDLVSQDRTVIMIAHRLTTLKNCDRILVMEQGCLSQTTYDEHLKKTGDANHDA